MLVVIAAAIVIIALSADLWGSIIISLAFYAAASIGAFQSIVNFIVNDTQNAAIFGAAAFLLWKYVIKPSKINGKTP